MTIPGPLRRLILVIAALLLIVLAWYGFTNAIRNFSKPAMSVGQLTQSVTQLVYSSFAVLSVIAALWARRWFGMIRWAWIVSVTVSAGLAPVVWGGTSVVIGIVSAAVGFLAGFGLAKMLEVGTTPSAVRVASRSVRE